jgi:hypothetical protein
MQYFVLPLLVASAVWANAQNAAAVNGVIGKSYFADCSTKSSVSIGTTEAPLHSIAQINAIQLKPGDSLFFKRGTTCRGQLHPQGSGNSQEPIRIDAYGEGALPRIVADSKDESAFLLFNQQYWEVNALDLSGGTTYGVHVSGDQSQLHHIYFRNLHIHDVKGDMKHKESGLLVVNPASKRASFQDVEIDGIQAANTTQWSGIFVLGASHVRIRNCMVHDMQGDGIVVYEGKDAQISRSVAWHTGMQERETIGTPNAIWTWRCIDCVVEENEAFLTDTPSVDGGAFDVDYGNIRNIVRRNYGHDTSGYCIAVFGSAGETIDSIVAENLCIGNGRSSRSAYHQGAILIMTWEGGTLKGVEISGNRIDWQPPGDSAVIHAGADLQASGIVFKGNELWSMSGGFIDPALKYTGSDNHYVLSSGSTSDLDAVRRRVESASEKNSTVTMAQSALGGESSFGAIAQKQAGWQLVATVPEEMLSGEGNELLRGLIVELKSAALQYHDAGLSVKLHCPVKVASVVKDWWDADEKVQVEVSSTSNATGYSLRLISPDGKEARAWQSYPGPVELGLALRQNIGGPVFSHLPFENISAAK